jgi:hypothetical protein
MSGSDLYTIGGIAVAILGTSLTLWFQAIELKEGINKIGAYVAAITLSILGLALLAKALRLW